VEVGVLASKQTGRVKPAAVVASVKAQIVRAVKGGRMSRVMAAIVGFRVGYAITFRVLLENETRRQGGRRFRFSDLVQVER
jgi:hypothetical protein